MRLAQGSGKQAPERGTRSSVPHQLRRSAGSLLVRLRPSRFRWGSLRKTLPDLGRIDGRRYAEIFVQHRRKLFCIDENALVRFTARVAFRDFRIEDGQAALRRQTLGEEIGIEARLGTGRGEPVPDLVVDGERRLERERVEVLPALQRKQRLKNEVRVFADEANGAGRRCLFNFALQPDRPGEQMSAEADIGEVGAVGKIDAE